MSTIGKIPRILIVRVIACYPRTDIPAINVKVVFRTRDDISIYLDIICPIICVDCIVFSFSPTVKNPIETNGCFAIICPYVDIAPSIPKRPKHQTTNYR